MPSIFLAHDISYSYLYQTAPVSFTDTKILALTITGLIRLLYSQTALQQWNTLCHCALCSISCDRFNTYHSSYHSSIMLHCWGFNSSTPVLSFKCRKYLKCEIPRNKSGTTHTSNRIDASFSDIQLLSLTRGHHSRWSFYYGCSSWSNLKGISVSSWDWLTTAAWSRMKSKLSSN